MAPPSPIADGEMQRIRIADLLSDHMDGQVAIAQ